MKRFMMAAALFGAMTLGACVDNQESQSVTDIRDAKTEELKSLAALNNAQAEAVKIMANAEAALKAAEAAYQQAMAEQVEAQTELVKIQAEIAAIEVQIKETELEEKLVELEAAQALLLTQKAEYEKRIVQAQADMAKAEASLEVYLTQQEYQLLLAKKDVLQATMILEAAEKIDYISLYNEYETAINNLNNARASLLNKQNELKGHEIGTVAMAELYASEIETQLENIENYNKEIAKYQAQIEAYSEFVTMPGEELEVKAEELNAKMTANNTAAELAGIAYDNWNNKQEVVDPYDLDFVNYVSSWASAMYPEYKQPFSASEEVGWAAPVVNWKENAIGYFVEGADPAYPEFIPMIENIDEILAWDSERGDYAELLEIEDAEGNYTYFYGVYELMASVNEEGWSKYLAAWGKAIDENGNEQAVKDAKKALEDLVKAVNSTEKGKEGALTLYAAALEAYTKAKAADEAAIAAVEAAEKAVKDPAKPTETEKGAIADAEKAQAKTAEALTKAEEALNTARTNKEAAETAIEQAEDAVANAEHLYKWDLADYEAVCEEYEAIKEMYAEAQAEVEAYNAFAKESVIGELALEVMATTFESDALAAEAQALAEAYAADDSYEDPIAEWEDAIENCETLIEEAEEYIAELEQKGMDDEEFLNRIKETIAQLELKVAAYQKTADEAKAKLDAALAE